MGFLKFNVLFIILTIIPTLCFAGLNPVCFKIMGVRLYSANLYFSELASENWRNPTPDNTTALLKAPSAPHRKQAAMSIGALKSQNSDRILPLIEVAINDPNADVRSIAAEDLVGNKPGPEYSRLLAKALRSNDPKVAQMAIKGFQGLDDPDSLAEIENGLKLQQYEFQGSRAAFVAYKKRLVESLRGRPDDGALVLVLKAIENYWTTPSGSQLRPDFYYELAEILAASPNPNAKNKIVNFLAYRDGGPNIHYLRSKLTTLYFTKNSGDPADVPWIKVLLLSPARYTSDFEDNFWMIDSLAKIQNDDSKKVLNNVVAFSKKKLAVAVRAKRPLWAEAWKKQIDHINSAISGS